MGYRFTSSTWRAPIQIIDSWLPDPALTESTRKTFGMSQLLSRVGWISRNAANTGSHTATAPARHALISPAHTNRSWCVRVLRQPEAASGSRPDARLVISGRIDDVCAELDRLAYLESRQKRHS
jgi:hypothetical protein